MQIDLTPIQAVAQRVEVIGRAVLVQADCRDVLPVLPKVDACVTDPPYGVNLAYEGYEDTPENLASLAGDWLPLARAISDRVVFTTGIKTISLYPQPDWILCWAISGAGGMSPWGFSCWQPIMAYGRDPYLAAGLGSRPDLIFKNETSEKTDHPCPKPAGFMKALIARVSLDNHSIADCFMGSGTTGVAAVQMGRDFIGIEREAKYFDIACKRIEQAQRQGDLFIGDAA